MIHEQRLTWCGNLASSDLLKTISPQTIFYRVSEISGIPTTSFSVTTSPSNINILIVSGVEAQQPSNGHSADVEAAINTNEIELNDDSVDSKTKQEEQQATTESEVRVTEELSNQHSHIDNEVRVETEEANQESDAAPQSPPSGDWQLVDKGETNPTFEKDEE